VLSAVGTTLAAAQFADADKAALKKNVAALAVLGNAGKYGRALARVTMRMPLASLRTRAIRAHDRSPATQGDDADDVGSSGTLATGAYLSPVSRAASRTHLVQAVDRRRFPGSCRGSTSRTPQHPPALSVGSSERRRRFGYRETGGSTPDTERDHNPESQGEAGLPGSPQDPLHDARLLWVVATADVSGQVGPGVHGRHAD